MTSPPYVVEKIPNLLCFVLLLPLVDTTAPSSEAQRVAARLGTSKGAGGLPPTVARPSGKVPAMHATRTGESSCVVTVHGAHASIYAQIPLDCWVDIERSSLTLRGDHLVARLAFTHFHAAHSTRLARESLYPAPVELDAATYAQGLQCRSCGCAVSRPLSAAHRAPTLPWGELIECLTCVRAEDYLGSGTVDPAFVVPDGRVAPGAGACIVSATMVSVNASSALNCHVAEAAPDVPPLMLGEHESAAGWAHVECAQCRAWLGDCAGGEIRLYKCALAARGSAFDKYEVLSVLGGAMLDAAQARECYRFVLAGPSSHVACGLVLLSAESWLATHQRPELHPALKVLYWKDASFVRQWASEHGAEWVVLRSVALCERIVNALDDVNALLPHSARAMKDGSLLSFLLW